MTSKGKHLNSFQHTLLRPDTYIGSVKTTKTKVWLFDEESKCAVQKKVPYNSGLMHIVREIGSNCIDNKWRSQENNIVMKKISIDVDEETGQIIFENDGLHIPVKLEKYEHENYRTKKKIVERCYPAEMFFGEMLAGTNFNDDEDRKTSGKNGIGAKATNIFSREFKVEHVDPIEKKKFTQVYTDNGKNRTEPKITKYTRKAFTRITFTPDYKYFNYPSKEKHGIDKNFISILRMYAYEIAMITGLTVVFNGDKIKIRSLAAYAKLYYPDSKVVNLKSNRGDECVILEREGKEFELKTPNHVSFVNGVLTASGGVHVNAWSRKIFDKLVRKFNKLHPSPPGGVKASSKRMYPYLMMFLRVEVSKPMFTGQKKDYLDEPVIKVEIEKSELEHAMGKIMKWDFVELMKDRLYSKAESSISNKETSGGTKVRGFGKKLNDANWAGGKKRDKTILCLTEGLSAKTFVEQGVSNIPDGNNIYGIFSLTGKILNTQNKTALTIHNNKVISSIKTVLGMRHGVDYSKSSERAKLRYGQLWIITDADKDGVHIRGLLLNFCSTEAPGLLESGYVKSFSTAVVGAKYKDKKGSRKNFRKLFYSDAEFDSWYKSFDDKSLIKEVEYFKGLGSISPNDTPIYWENPKLVSYVCDEDMAKTMKLAFNTKVTDSRKKWLLENYGRVNEDFVYEGDLTVSKFVNTQLIDFALQAIRRAIPNIMDGLKESQRKIIFAMKKKGYKQKTKVEIIKGDITSIADYHHGPQSLEDTLVGMGQGFVGSNNIPLLVNDGQFGSRQDAGNDASSGRYLSTFLEKIVDSIFRKEDDPILTYRNVDGEIVEPEFYIPVVPLLLINGSQGIAVGFSTTIPCHNPLDIIKWIECWLEEKETPELIPWYRNFTGKITKKGNVWTSFGTLKKDKKFDKGKVVDAKGWWLIDEVPIGVKPPDVYQWLEYLEDGKDPRDTKGKKWAPLKFKCIKDLEKKMGGNECKFSFKSTKDFIPDIETPRNLSILKKSIKMSNLVATDVDYVPQLYKNVNEIMSYFCEHRLPYYEKRKQHIISVLEKDIVVTRNRYKFVTLVVDDKLKLKQAKANVIQDMENYSLDKIDESYMYLLDMPAISFTTEKIESLKTQYEKMEKTLEIIKERNVKEMWKDDLKDFKKAYDKFLKTRKDDPPKGKPKKTKNRKH